MGEIEKFVQDGKHFYKIDSGGWTVTRAFRNLHGPDMTTSGWGGA